MTAGMPGTGIGGIFYIILVALMPLRELWLTLHGRSSLARWKTVLVQWWLAVAILATLWGEAWVVKWGFARLGEVGKPGGALDRISIQGTAALVPAFALAPFVILGTLYLAMHAARIMVSRQTRLREPVAPAKVTGA